MNYHDLRKYFHDQVYPSRPNEWDVEDVLHDLKGVGEKDQRLLLQAVPAVWPISHSLTFSFLKAGARNAPSLEPSRLAEWIRRILHNYETGGLKRARTYMANSDPGMLEEEHDEKAAVLEENLGRLTSYARGVSGRDVILRPSDAIYTDTENIYLPEMVDYFSTIDKNLLYYKLLINVHTSFISQGSLLLRRLWRRAESGWEHAEQPWVEAFTFFEQCGDQQCARELYQLLELYRAGETLQREYPGLFRETHAIRKKLMLLRVGNVHGRNRKLESLLTASLLPEEAGHNRKSRLQGFTRAWMDGSQPFAEVLRQLYEHVMAEEECATPFSFSPFMARFRFDEAWRVTEKRIEQNTNMLATALADFLEKKRRGQKGDEERLHPSAEQADTARLVLAEETTDTSRPLERATIMIDNHGIELSDEVKALLSRLLADTGKLPESIVSAAFGLAGGGRNKGEEGSETVRESAERFIPYDEWDYRRQGYRKNWCALRQRTLPGIRSDFVERTLVKHRPTLLKIRRQFEMMRTQERFAKRRRYGDDLDLDALIDSLGDQQAGLPPSEKVFIRLLRNERSISTCFLVDMSNSTEGWIGVAIKEALVLLCEALEAVGDRYGIYGFSGMRRMRSEVYKIKGFDERYAEGVKRRIAAIAPKEYTRMGPPIRHMIGRFAEADTKNRLLLILSDGKPEDYDEYKGEYAIEDTRKALAEARGQGIHPYCITIDRESHDYLEHLFGRGNYTYVKNIAQLPPRLTEIYRILTR